MKYFLILTILFAFLSNANFVKVKLIKYEQEKYKKVIGNSINSIAIF